ncbi:MAG: M48 family metalloprotease [Desulfobacterales bacterium]|nr:M48 family metalloprotease [Desulfobacterales bacterium]
MFANFLYFIIALLIYIVHQPKAETYLGGIETLAAFICLIIIFTLIVRFLFNRLQKKAKTENSIFSGNRFDRLMTRMSIFSLFILAINIYGLSLKSFFIDITFFTKFPTAQAFIFMGLFIFYLSILWRFAYKTYQKVYNVDVSRKEYILSNISFSVPVLLPWFVLSIILDIINSLPFETPKHILATPAGEFGYFLFFLIIIAVFAPLIIKTFWKCTPLKASAKRYQIESLCKRAGLGYRDILDWPLFGGKMITAGVMGLVQKFRYILVTDAMLNFLLPEEIDAVIAHEIGHIKKKHLIFYLLFFLGFMLITYSLFDLFFVLFIFIDPLFVMLSKTGIDQGTATSVLFSILLVATFLIYFRYIFGYFMRNFERQADAYVYTLFDTALPMISTFRKIAATSGQSPDKPSWHHFSISERVNFLQKCETNRIWIKKQDGKVKRSIIIFITALTVITGSGIFLKNSDAGKLITNRLNMKIVINELEKSPDNTDLLHLLGDIYYGDKKFGDAILAYEKAISLNPHRAETVNNLAWLYATCEEKIFIDPERALFLARRAASLKPAPHILDTLAESYFINGLYDEAIETEMHALELVKTERAYYEAQLKKFRKAAGMNRSDFI